MRVVVLLSGGKDSVFSMVECVTHGHEIVAIANLHPPATGATNNTGGAIGNHSATDNDDDDNREGSYAEGADSWMYQTIGHNAISAIAECLEIPLFRHPISGTPKHTSLHYEKTERDEVEDLFKLLVKVRSKVSFEAVASGTILSTYQRVRIENVCGRLGLVSLSFLWRQDQTALLARMIDANMHSILVKTAGMGLAPRKHLGKSIAQLYPHLVRLGELYGCNVCGEGGEYESFTLDCPLFAEKKIEITESVLEGDLDTMADLAPVGVLHIKSFRVIEKSESEKQVARNTLAELRQQCDNDSIRPSYISVTVKEPRPIRPQSSSPSSPLSAVVCRLPAPADSHVAKFRSANVSRAGIVFVPMPCSGDGIQCDDNAEELTVRAHLESVGEILESHGCSWQDCFYAHFFLADMKAYVQANQVYAQLFSMHPPSRACVELPLPVPAMCNVLAYRYKRGIHGDESKSEVDHEEAICRPPVKTLHVQSVSRWAPCNIGPYSQATQICGMVYMAGQIGLKPQTMKLVSAKEADGHDAIAQVQTLQSLWNCQQVLQQMSSDMSHTLHTIVYFVSRRHGFQRGSAHSTARVVRSTLLALLHQHSRDIESELSCGIFEDGIPPLLFVQVRALPRDAIVELQPFAIQSNLVPVFQPHHQRNARKFAFENGAASCTVYSDCVMCAGASLNAILSVSCATCDCSVSCSVLPLLCSAIAKRLQSSVNEAKMQWCDVSTLRLFVVSHVAMQSVQHAFGGALAQFCGFEDVLPAVSFVPVEGLPLIHGENQNYNDSAVLALHATFSDVTQQMVLLDEAGVRFANPST